MGVLVEHGTWPLQLGYEEHFDARAEGRDRLGDSLVFLKATLDMMWIAQPGVLRSKTRAFDY